MTVNIAINGAGGRMGRQVIRAVQRGEGVRLCGGAVRAGSSDEGADLGRLAGLNVLGLAATGNESAFANAGAVIDFSTPGAAIAALDALPPGCAFVTGTTGYDEGQARILNEASQKRPVLAAGNFSLGVTLLEALAGIAARALGQDWDVEIHEAHHRRKADAPSGTALMLGRAVAEARGVELDTAAIHDRQGRTGERPKGGIGFSVKRAGGIIGDHELTFTSEREEIALRHRALDRAIFADGAVAAAVWAAGRPPGLYTMQDVLELNL